jgi:hypothetical protein
MIDRFLSHIPATMQSQSGAVFYSGRAAFGGRKPVYILGLNPGGSPIQQAKETLARHTEKILYREPTNWSAYRDESWLGNAPGTYGMQPRVLHLCQRLRLNPGVVPSSNLIFLRSAHEKDIKSRLAELADSCWPFHEKVIGTLRIRVVMCFGATAGNWVRNKLGAIHHVERFVENNDRHWQSNSYRNASGIGVVIATHPSIAAWNTPAAGPTHLVANLLAGRKRRCNSTLFA